MMAGMHQTDRPAPLIEVTRGTEVESQHRGYLAAVAADGQVLAQLGEIQTRTHFRSAAKPFQALPIVTTGAADHFQLTTRELAIINGSHSGEPEHLAAVQSILDKLGLTEAALQCGTHLPFDEATTKQLRAHGQPPRVLHNNCSGKHAGMLALAKYLNHPLENYLDPEHPIQRLIRVTLARFAAVSADDIGIAIDGCSAPVFSTTLAAMARSYAQLVSFEPSDSSAEQGLAQAAKRIVKAFISHPTMIGGTHKRLDTELMQVAEGKLISKVGAEGVQLLGVLPCELYPKGLGIAIKLEDGDIKRARDPVVIEALRQLGVLNPAQLQQLAPYARATLYNHRKLEVGMVRPCFTLQQ